MHTLSIDIQTNTGILLTKWIYQQGSCQSTYQRVFWSPILQHIHFMRYFTISHTICIYIKVSLTIIFFAIHISFIHTFLLESESHVMHLFAFIWKAISCHSLMGKADIFSLLVHILKIHFAPYVPILRRIFALFWHMRILAKHLATYPTLVCLFCPLLPTLHHLGAKKPSRCSFHPMGLEGKPYQFALIYSLLHLKTQVWISRLKHTFGHPP